MPDARAHGTSGGNLATFGLLETDDISRWLDWVQQNDHPMCIFGLGESMGAAELLQSLRTETRFCAAVAESPFASFREIGYDRVGPALQHGPMARPHGFSSDCRVRLSLRSPEIQTEFRTSLAEVAIAPPRFRSPDSRQADSNIPVRHADLIFARNPGISNLGSAERRPLRCTKHRAGKNFVNKSVGLVRES